MSQIGVRLEGLADLRKKLRGLPPKVSRKIVPKAFRKGAGIMKAAAKAEAPESGRTGKETLKRRIVFRSIRHKRQGEVVAFVVRSKAPHSHLIQLGTDRRRTKKGANRGRITPNDFMARAFQKTVNKVTRVIETEIKIGIERAAQQL